MDKITKERRSWNMSRIHGKNTAPEIIVRKFLYGHGVRYRIHAKLPGKPDIAILGKKIAIFVNGCFWHAHECNAFRWPQTRSDFWRSKLEANIERDRQNYQTLANEGWKILIVWECALSNGREVTLNTLLKDIKM